MKKLIFFLLLNISTLLYAQDNLPNRKIQLSGGYSPNGSGDLPRFLYGAEYSNYFKKKLSWFAGFNGFIYDGEDPITNQRSNATLPASASINSSAIEGNIKY